MRYALYYLPEEQSPLAQLGASLLGWDIYAAAPYANKDILYAFEKVGFTLGEEKLATMTQEARRYGLHATLKAPFYLAEGFSEAQLIQRVDTFAATLNAFSLPPLYVKRMGDFLALTVQNNTEQACQHTQKIYDFAAQCVQHFEDCRRPLSAMELVRRRQKTLSHRQEEYLLRFGYPYVLEDFRFHLTLCHVCEAKDQGWNELLQKALSEVFSPMLQGNNVTALYLCRSDENGRFRLLHRSWLR